MKILIATPLYPPDIGGPATYTKLLEKELPKKGIAVLVVNFAEVRHLPKGLRHLIYFFKVWRQARAVEIVYAQDPVSVGLPAMLAAKLRRKKFMVRIPGDYAWEQAVLRYDINGTLDEFVNENKNYPLTIRLFKKIETLVCRQAKIIVVPSQYLKRVVLAWGISETKIKVIHNAFDNQFSDLTKSSARESLKLDGRILVSAGRLVPWKGFLKLIEVVNSLKQDYPDLKLIIIGDGPERKKLDQVINENKLEKKVILTSRLSKDRLFEYLKAADLFVLNTAYEGLSHQILEVMALSVPVAVSSVGGNPELITEDETGWLFPYNDQPKIRQAIKDILDNPTEANRRAEAGKNKLKDFGLDQAILKITDTLNSL